MSELEWFSTILYGIVRFPTISCVCFFPYGSTLKQNDGRMQKMMVFFIFIMNFSKIQIRKKINMDSQQKKNAITRKVLVSAASLRITLLFVANRRIVLVFAASLRIVLLLVANSRIVLVFVTKSRIVLVFAAKS